MNLFVIEHEPDASVGRLAPHLAAHQVTMVRPAGGDALPPTAGIDGVIVLGGSMGAYEVDEHPWLVDEKAWIAQVVRDDVPMLGICLGAQLLADATGVSRIVVGAIHPHDAEDLRHGSFSAALCAIRGEKNVVVVASDPSRAPEV